MNDSVKLWAFSACSSVVIASITMMLAPKFGKKGIFRWIISIFVLIGIVSPFIPVINSSISADKKIPISNQVIISDEYIEKLEDAVSVNLYPIIGNELEKIGIKDDFGLKTKISFKNNEMNIEYVNISVSDLHKNKSEYIISEMKSKIGLNITVSFLKRS